MKILSMHKMKLRLCRFSRIRNRSLYVPLVIMCVFLTAIYTDFTAHVNERWNDLVCLERYKGLGDMRPVGNITANMIPRELQDMASDFWWLQFGGHHSVERPQRELDVHERVAIITPVRDREGHLKILLNNLHPILHRQNLQYSVYVVEQADTQDFNKGTLLNIGYMEALKRYNYTCFVFHDVDLIPEDDRISYGCCRSPMHLSYAIDKFNYNLPDTKLIGGVSAWLKNDFEAVNGWSNLFYNWGGEDDDMSYRIYASGRTIKRMSPSISRYKMIKHKQSKINSDRYKMLSNSYTRYKKDGLSSLRYQQIQVVEQPLFTRIRVVL